MRTLKLALSLIAVVIVVTLVSCDTTKPINRPPTANAGPSQEVEIGSAQVFLNGSASSDPDNDTLTFRWRQSSGPMVVLSDSTAVTLTFAAPATIANLVFELEVNDGKGGTSTDNTIVRVNASSGNAPPFANAGADQTVIVRLPVTLSGSGSDPFGGPVTYRWSQIAGGNVVLSSVTAPRPTFAAPIAPDVLSFELTVTDEDARFTSDSTTVTIGLPDLPTPTLYVVNESGSVTGFWNPGTTNGNAIPQLQLEGPATELESAWDATADANGALLVASRTGAILSFAADNQTGNVAPNRRVGGGDTGLLTPTAIAIDAQADILFVMDRQQEGVLVYDGVSRSTFDGNVPPSRSFWTPNLTMEASGASYDSARDYLYIAESSTGVILVYHAASAANRQVAFSRSIQHLPSTGNLTDVFIDAANDRLYATNDQRGEVYVWDNASIVTGAQAAPSRTLEIGGSPKAIAVDAANRGYVADAADAIFSFDAIHVRGGRTTPSRTIRGPATGLSSPRGVFVLE